MQGIIVHKSNVYFIPIEMQKILYILPVRLCHMNFSFLFQHAVSLSVQYTKFDGKLLHILLLEKLEFSLLNLLSIIITKCPFKYIPLTYIVFYFIYNNKSLASSMYLKMLPQYLSVLIYYKNIMRFKRESNFSANEHCKT